MKHAIPDDWDGESFCRFAICWPDTVQWRALLRGLITEPARGFFWDEKTGSIIGVLGQFRQTVDQNIELPEVFMACNDTNIGDALQAIAQAIVTASANAAAAAEATATALTRIAIVTGGCCENRGTGGQGQTAPPYNPVIPGNPEIDPPPDGFEDWPQFDTNKCAVATDILKTLRVDISNMSTVNWQGLVLAEAVPILVALLLDPIPGDEIIFACGLLIAAGTVAARMFDALGDFLEEYEHDLICTLYESLSAQDAETRFENKFYELWYSSTYEEFDYNFSAISLINSMVGPAVTNRLFELQSDRILPSGDCSDCGEPEITLRFQDANGEWQFIPDFVWGEEYSFTAPTQGNGFRYLNFRCYPEYQFPNWENAYCDVSAINASDTGHCNDSQTFTPGTYGPMSNDGSTVNFNFGCSNSSPMTITARFYLPEELMP